MKAHLSPEAYSAARKSLGTHKQAAELLGIEEQTSRNYAVRGADRRAEITLKLIEALGVEKARAIINRQEKQK
jgi:hypothetical protein